jgi:hypothetical protein
MLVTLLKAMPMIVGAIETGSRITRQSLQKKSAPDSLSVRSPAARVGPKKISIARLPVTGSNFFGRESELGETILLDLPTGQHRGAKS